MNDLMERASLVVFATHSLDVLPRFCERTLLLRQGRIIADGPTAEVVRLYTEGEPLMARTLAAGDAGR
jgi:ABC-type polysaccharide/polyol phosphate transport system ATPase subunit